LCKDIGDIVTLLEGEEFPPDPTTIFVPRSNLKQPWRIIST
jgi:hypothetical protein